MENEDSPTIRKSRQKKQLTTPETDGWRSSRSGSLDEKEKLLPAEKILGEDQPQVNDSYSYQNRRNANVAIRVVLPDNRPQILPVLEHMRSCEANCRSINPPTVSGSYWFSLVNVDWNPHQMMRTRNKLLKTFREFVCEKYSMADGNVYWKGLIKFRTSQRASCVEKILRLGGNLSGMIVYTRAMNTHGVCEYVMRPPLPSEEVAVKSEAKMNTVVVHVFKKIQRDEYLQNHIVLVCSCHI